MLKVICVKIGELYNSNHVNRLLRITSKRLSIPFEFYCYTDNPKGITDKVNIIPFHNNNIDVVVHNKLALFSNYIEDIVGDGPRVYFDLDIVFCSNIDSIARYNNKNLTIIQATWRTPVYLNFPLFQHDLNSSCMTWERSIQTASIWEHYRNNKEVFQENYHMGMDPFLYYEFYANKQSPITISTFPMGLFRSHIFGIDYAMNEKLPDSKNGRYNPSEFDMFMDKFPVILLNGKTTDHDMETLDAVYSV